MDDLISRQAAIDAFRKELCRERVYATPFISFKGCERILNELPSAERRGRWIPVTERLPEEEGKCLVCCNGKYHPIEVARFYIDEDGERYFCCDWNDPEDIVAWMPLPEPYKEGEQNG